MDGQTRVLLALLLISPFSIGGKGNREYFLVKVHIFQSCSCVSVCDDYTMKVAYIRIHSAVQKTSSTRPMWSTFGNGKDGHKGGGEETAGDDSS